MDSSHSLLRPFLHHDVRRSLLLPRRGRGLVHDIDQYDGIRRSAPVGDVLDLRQDRPREGHRWNRYLWIDDHSRINRNQSDAGDLSLGPDEDLAHLRNLS